MNPSHNPKDKPPVVRMYERISRKYRGTNSPKDGMTGVMLFAAANWKALEPLWEAQIGYAHDEGLHPEDLWRSKIDAQLRRNRR